MRIIFKDRGFSIISDKIDNNRIYTVITNNPEETIELGKKLGNILNKGDLIAVNGELGTGKTCLIKGIAIGLKSREDASSPSFSIIKEYSAKIPIYHFDLYRLRKSEDIEELGYEEYFYGEGITLIEWADKIENYLPEKLLLIEIFTDGDNVLNRKIIFQARGERYKKIVEELKSIENIGN